MAGLLLLVATLAGGLAAAVGLFGTLELLPRNRWLGLPSALRLDEDELWVKAHRRGGPVLLFGGIAVVMTGLAFGPFVLAGNVPAGVLIPIVIAQVALIALTVGVGAVVGRSGISHPETGSR